MTPARPPARLRSAIATEAQLDSLAFRGWTDQMREQWQRHRKLWEWCYIAQALDERGMLAAGRRGLGFAVGTEPLASLFAARGADVLATDLAADQLAAGGQDWNVGNQHARGLESLNGRSICPPAEFAQRVRFRPVDMNHLPADLTGFDFCWSSCSFEHLGSITLGRQFLVNMAACLKPGGVAVHTTEFNLSSDEATVEEGSAVLFRRRDVEAMAADLRAVGCRLADRDYTIGGGAADWHVDRPPFTHVPHLRLELSGYVCTSIGLIIEKDA